MSLTGRAIKSPGINICRLPAFLHFALAAWRYSSRGFRTFNDYIWANNKQEYQRDNNDIYDIGDYYTEDFGRKNSFSVNISQTLPDNWGSLALSGVWRDYWQHQRDR